MPDCCAYRFHPVGAHLALRYRHSWVIRIQPNPALNFDLLATDGVLTGDADVLGHGVHEVRYLPLLAGLAARGRIVTPGRA